MNNYTSCSHITVYISRCSVVMSRITVFISFCRVTLTFLPVASQADHYRNAPIQKRRSWKCKWVKNDVNLVSINKSPGYIPFLVIVPAQTSATFAYYILRWRIELHATNNSSVWRGAGALDEPVRTSASEAILPANKVVSTVHSQIVDTGSERAFSDSRAQLWKRFSSITSLSLKQMFARTS